MKIEFLPWYQPNQNMLRCGGDGGCGALLVSGDAELHTKWHTRIDYIEALAIRTANRLDRPNDHARVLGA